MPKKFDNNKVTIIGCGHVGMTAAFALAHSKIVNELVLFGRDLKRLKGEALDLDHSLSFLHSMRIKPSANYMDVKESDIVIITAGAAQKPGETRLDLAAKNIKIIEQIIPQVVRYAPDAIIIIVANPVDVLTYHAIKLTHLPKGRIFGSGTLLDTTRFRFHLSKFLQINPKSIHAYILGEHGDSSFPVLSSATVASQPLNLFPNFSHQKALEAYEKTRQAAYQIIASKGYTQYGIAAVIAYLVKTIFSDSKEVLPVSVPLRNYLDISDVALSVPCIVGRNGVEQILTPKLDWQEKKLLEKSAQKLKAYL